MILKYTDEKTFITEDIEFSEEYYNLANGIYEQCKLDKCSPLMVSSDKKSLIFGVNLGDSKKDRVAYEIGKQKYRIKIEKI